MSHAPAPRGMSTPSSPQSSGLLAPSPPLAHPGARRSGSSACASVSAGTPRPAVDSALVELVGSVQHELRTPLHGMLLLADSLRSDLRAAAIADMQQKQALVEQASSIKSLGDGLNDLLEDFADFASITTAAREEETRHEIVRAESVDLGALLDDVASELWNEQVQRIRTQEGADARIPPPPELILQIDTSLRGTTSMIAVETFRKCARKLISNALRFTQGEGYVEISLAPHTEEGRSSLQLTVEDTGEGMTDEFVAEALFKPFMKADKFKSGAGLGMALCASLCKRMGGSMQVSSDVGRGTIVTLLIPVAELPRVPQQSVSSRPAQLTYMYGFEGIGLKRLAGAISAQLATFGDMYATTNLGEADYLLIPEEACWEATGGIEGILSHAKDGVKIGVLQAHADSGVELAAFKNGSRQPAFVTRKPFGPKSFHGLLQLARKPETDAQATKLRRTDSGRDSFEQTHRMSSESNEPKIAESPPSEADGDADSVDKVPSAAEEQAKDTRDLVFAPESIDEVLRAPVDSVPMLAPLAGKMRQEAPSSPSVKPITVSKFGALVVEDNPLNARILTRLMKKQGIEFCVATNGQEAVEQFAKHSPYVTLLDIMMPVMSGFEACQAMRALPLQGPRRPKIIAVTALSDELSRTKGLEECGMDEWLTKPLAMNRLLEDLKRWRADFDAEGQTSES